MSEPNRKDTRDAPAESHPQRARQSERSYYYDDATGYEIYNPETDDEERIRSNDQEDDRSDAPQNE